MPLAAQFEKIKTKFIGKESEKDDLNGEYIQVSPEKNKLIVNYFTGAPFVLKTGSYNAKESSIKLMYELEYTKAEGIVSGIIDDKHVEIKIESDRKFKNIEFSILDEHGFEEGKVVTIEPVKYAKSNKYSAEVKKYSGKNPIAEGMLIQEAKHIRKKAAYTCTNNNGKVVVDEINLEAEFAELRQQYKDQPTKPPKQKKEDADDYVNNNRFRNSSDDDEPERIDDDVEDKPAKKEKKFEVKRKVAGGGKRGRKKKGA